MFKKLNQYFEEVLCTFFLSVVFISVITQVVLRFGFSSAAVWAEETAVYGLIFATYLGASLGIKRREHVRITFIVLSFPKKLKVASIISADFLWLGFLALMIVQTIVYTKLLFDVSYVLPGLKIELRWLQMFMPLTFCLMVYRVFEVYWEWKKTGWKGLPL
jgi:C4-dicarboxylate transporter DctQ subunit